MNLHDEIAKVAHELYEKSGRAPGCDRENWLEAERIVKARLVQQNSGPVTEVAKDMPVKSKTAQASPKKSAVAGKTTAKRTTRTK